MKVLEGDHAIFALDDIFFLDDAFVEVLAEIDQGFVAVANVFAVHHPLFRTVFWHLQIVVDDFFQELGPEHLG